MGIDTIDKLFMSVGNEYKIYARPLPLGLEKNISVQSSDNGIILVDDDSIKAIKDGQCELHFHCDDYVLSVPAYVGIQTSDDLSIQNNRNIDDIVLVSIPTNLNVGDQFACYCIGINTNDEEPYTVFDSNLLKYSSNNSSVCSVEYGTLIANKSGSATITVSDLNNRVSKTFTVNVINESRVETNTYNVTSSMLGNASSVTTLKLQEAIDYAISNGYSKINIENGTYYLNGDVAEINIKSGLNIDFNDSTIILEYSNKTDSGYSMIHLDTVNDVVIQNATFYGEDYTRFGGNKSNTTLSIYGNCNNIKFINCNFWYSSGFNVSLFYTRESIVSFKLANVEGGTINDDGSIGETSTIRYRSKDYIDITSLKSKFGLGNMQGFQGYKYMQSRLYDIWFFDESKTLISYLKYCVQYHLYDKPNNAKYCKIMFYQNFIPTSGDADYNSIASIYSIGQPNDIKFIDCSFKYNVMTGLSPQGVTNLLIKNCTFEDNGSADPYAHIDWEDGRIHIQSHVVDKCTFIRTESKWHSNIAMLNGRGIVFKNSVLNDNTISQGANFYLTSEMQNAVICRNRFVGYSVNLASKTDMIYCGNVESKTHSIGDVLDDMTIFEDNNKLIE